jgi:hypothetical protein
MNDGITLLAQLDSQRTVMHCNRGQLHLNWGCASLHLTATELADLARFLRGVDRKLRPNGYCGNPRHFVMWTGEDQCLAWLHGLGLHLAQSDLARMAAMVDEAQRILWTGALAPKEQQLAVNLNSVTYYAEEGRGQVFINWRQVTLAFSTMHFSAMIDFLRMARFRLNRSNEHADGSHWIQRDEEGYHQLWLRGMGLYLSTVELERFDELCEQAFTQLESEANRQRRWGGEQFCRAAAKFSFSVN